MADSDNASTFENLGLVTGAIFVDYNKSGEQDLIITTEWGSVRVFENNGGRFTEKTTELGLDQFKGMWQGVAAGDFNGDGYPDIVAANLGENSPYQVESKENPLRIYYGDFNRDQRLDMIESYYDPEIDGYVPRNRLSEYEHISEILGHVQSNEQFSEMTIGEMLRTDQGSIPSKEVNTVQHRIFLNNGGNGFTSAPLPAEAQFSAGFHVAVADANNDGYEDIFMTQNFFGVADPQSSPRLDAGRGIWMLGDGEGNFDSVPGHQSGVKIYGEQRGSAVSDFNDDGRVDLVVSQNSAQSRIFQNQTEQQGITIRLSGPVQNTSGYGSAIRLVYDDGSKGPVRTIQAGSGYWSQNSAVQVLGFSQSPAAVEVQWPSGEIQTVDLSEGQTKVVIEYE